MNQLIEACLAASEKIYMENFAELLEEYSSAQEMTPGEVITAEVIAIDDATVTVNAGLKSEAWIDVNEFKDANGDLEVKVGDFVTVTIESLENGFGETKLSRVKARRAADWIILENALQDDTVLTGVINGKVKGGLTVMVNSIRAFLPGSLLDIRPIKDVSAYEGKEIEFKVIKLDKKRNNVVISRRAVLEETLSEEREALLSTLEEGSIVKGIVKNITNYGAFVDLGGIDGLLHITDLAWDRMKHPSELLETGQEIEAKVLKFDQERRRVSLGLKQLQPDPWEGLDRRYPVGTRLYGTVTNLTDYGAFVEIEKGIEGLVHVSEMDWTNKNVYPSKIVQVGDEVQVMILDVDAERRRISLGMKQCVPNPWEEFEENHQKGEKITGTIKSITDFGIFVGLPGGIDGLIHVSDLSWHEPGEQAIRNYKKGDELTAIILAIDTAKERISLGVKQSQGDPFNSYVEAHEKSSIVKGRVKSVEPKLVTVELAEDVEGQLKVSDIPQERMDDASEPFKEGDEVEAIIVGIDRRNRTVNLSMRAMIEKQKAEVLDTVNRNNLNTGTTNLGDLLKEKLSQQPETES